MVALYQIDTVCKRFYVIFIFTILYHFGTHILYIAIYTRKKCAALEPGKAGVKGKKTRAGPTGLLNRIRRMPCPVLSSLCARSFVGVVNDKESSIIQPAERERIVACCPGGFSAAFLLDKARFFQFFDIPGK